MKAAKENAAVVKHLVRLIRDSPDVRYYVGGPCTQMRTLLVAAIIASGYEGDPEEVLEPAPHHADDEPHIERVKRDRDRLENGLEAILAARFDDERVRVLVEDLQAGKEVA